jgi:hypothetical protein
MSIASEIERIKTNIANAYTACQEKGAILPTILNSENLASCVSSITGGEIETGGYVEKGLLLNLSGEDAPINNTWVDRVSSIPVKLVKSPTYDSANKCYSFNGTNQYGTFTLSGAGADFTLEVYYKQDTNGRLDVMVGKSAGNRMGYGIINADSKNYCWYAGASDSPKILPESDKAEQVAGQITYNRVSRQGSEIYFGHKDNTKSIAKNYTGTSTYISELEYSIGKNGYSSVSSTFYSQVKIYAIRVYNRCLTEEEIQQNYEQDVEIYGA